MAGNFTALPSEWGDEPREMCKKTNNEIKRYVYWQYNFDSVWPFVFNFAMLFLGALIEHLLVYGFQHYFLKKLFWVA
jgi:hypothetical protein